MSKINLTIDRLVLEGVPLSRAESVALGGAVEVELARLVAEGGLSHANISGCALHPLSAAPIVLSPAASPTDWGRQVAQSVYGSLATPTGPKPVGGKRR